MGLVAAGAGQGNHAAYEEEAIVPSVLEGTLAQVEDTTLVVGHNACRGIPGAGTLGVHHTVRDHSADAAEVQSLHIDTVSVEGSAEVDFFLGAGHKEDFVVTVVVGVEELEGRHLAGHSVNSVSIPL